MGVRRVVHHVRAITALALAAVAVTEVRAQAPSVRAGSSPWVVLVPYPV